MMFWIHLLVHLLMLALDATWWFVALRLVQRTLWRVLISLFIGAQMFGLVLSTVGFDLAQHIPQAALAAYVLWHHFGLAALISLGMIWMCGRMVRRYRAKPVSPEVPVTAPVAADSVSRREFIGACAAIAPPLLTFGITGVAMGQINRFRLRRFTLSIPTLPRQLDGTTIAHVSDIHVGQWTHGPVLQEIVNATNALRADIVAVTGDLINYELSDLSEAIALIKKMQGRYGLWMIEGNHDLIENGPEFERRVKALGVPLLLDESVVSNVRGYPVQFFGLRWMDGIGSYRDRVTAHQVSDVMKERQPDAFPLLLAHHPHAFDAAAAADLPLTLSGHTHGGQLMLDSDIGVGPALFRYWSGLYQRRNSQMIVSNGAGNMFPLRINAPAEIAHITLRSA